MSLIIGDLNMEKKMKISLNELFSGIGAQRKALLKLGFEVDVVGVSEIDKYAIQSYEAIFGETRNYGDICDVPRLDYADLWTYSFPCQDISVAGHQKGINENTRSGLLYQVQRLLEVAKEENTLPKYLLLENVKNLVGKHFKKQFEEWIEYLDELGYKTYWQVLNAKDYGIPQNRERVFAVSIRKDIDLNFAFPPKMKLQKRLKDILEDEVEDKYYLSEKLINGFLAKIERGKLKPNGFNREINIRKPDDIATTITARYWKCGITDPYVECPSVVAVREATKKGYAEATVGDSINIEQPNSKTRRGRVGHGVAQTLTTAPQQVVLEPKIQQVGNIVNTGNWNNPQRGRIYDSNGISPTLNTMQGGGLEPKILDNLKIRKLTPLECWRLMGFDDEDFYKAQKSGVSNTQLYKQAGNSIVVDVLEEIFTNFVEW